MPHPSLDLSESTAGDGQPGSLLRCKHKIKHAKARCKPRYFMSNGYFPHGERKLGLTFFASSTETQDFGSAGATSVITVTVSI